MRFGIVFTFILLFLVRGTLTAQWTLLNPMPTNEHLTALYFVDSLTGYLVGEHGTVVRTTDGGATWVNRNAPISWTLNDVAFTSALEGVVVGELGTILKTYDGGITWLDVGNYDPPLNSIFFSSGSTGYAVGLGGTILKSEDGGFSWIACPSAQENLYAVHFSDDFVGYACGENGSVIKTTDGGNLWQEQTSGTTHTLRCMDFPASDIGYAGGGIGWPVDGILIKTTDGGTTWAPVASYGTGTPTSIQFPTSSTGHVLSVFSFYKKTVNGGASWTSGSIGDYTTEMRDLFFLNEEVGYASGSFGEVFKTQDGGVTWMEKSSTFKSDLIDITFTDDMTGYVLSDQALYKSIDGGITWDSIFPDTNFTGNSHLLNISFPDRDTGFISTYSTIWKTSDAGDTWTLLPNPGYDINIYDIFFPSPAIGYRSGPFGHVWKTTDGGYTWEVSPISPSVNCYRLFFLSDTVGYVMSTNNTYYKTTNGGENWAIYDPGYFGSWRAIFFTDEENGYICGIGNTYKMLKTTDGGDSWSDITSAGMEDLLDIGFFSANNGYAVGEAKIYHTNDGGASWIVEKQLNHITYTKVSLTSSCIFTVGTDGTIMRRPDSVVTSIPDSKIIQKPLPLICYPNPFSDRLCIQYQLMEPAWVEVDLFTTSGISLKKLTIGNQQAGEQVIHIGDNCLPPGLLLFRIRAGTNTGTGKAVKY